MFLSAFTTKTAVYTLIVAFAGADILIHVGLYMACYGIVYALLENDMRRILAYSIVNQVGFMVAAVGIGTEMAINGAAAHAFTHIIYKALLLMSAGSVLYMTGARKCSDLGGLYRTMPVTAIAALSARSPFPAFPHLRLCFQGHDHEGSGRRGPDVRLADTDGRLRGRLSTRVSSFPGSSSSRKTAA